MKKNMRPWFVSLGSFLWATDSLFRSQLVKNFQSTFIVFIEHLMSIFITLPLFLKKWKNILKFDWKDWGSLLFVSLGGSALATIFFTKSFQLTSNYTVPVLIQKLQPIVAIIMAALILKEKLTKNFWLWSIIAIIGAYFVSFGGVFVFTSLKEAATLPVIYALLAVVFWGGSTVFGKYLLQKFSYEFITAIRYLAAIIWLGLMVLILGETGSFALIDPSSLLVFLGVALIPGFLALAIYYYGLKGTKASIATIAELTFPVSAIALNWVFLDSPLTITQILGAVILLGAITMLTRENKEK